MAKGMSAKPESLGPSFQRAPLETDNKPHRRLSVFLSEKLEEHSKVPLHGHSDGLVVAGILGVALASEQIERMGDFIKKHRPHRRRRLRPV